MRFQGQAASGDAEMKPSQPRNTPCKKVPDNPTSRHPVQLLNELRGTINYQLVEQVMTALKQCDQAHQH